LTEIVVADTFSAARIGRVGCYRQPIRSRRIGFNIAVAAQEACMNYRVMRGIVLLLCVSFVGAEQQSAITGQIVDSEGAAIAKARVIVHWDSSGSAVGLADHIGIMQDLIVVTDAKGRYSAGVPAGFYDVFVSAMAFTPTAAKVRVKQGQRAMHNSMLRADPLVSRELAH
jgi:carboxypeptidase family protein